MKIHQIIRLLRNSQRLSQENMAQELEISLNAYGEIERGNTKLIHDKLPKIAEVFGIKLGELLEMTEEGNVIFITTEKDNNVYCQNQNIYSGDNQSLKLLLEHQQETINRLEDLVQQQKSEISTLKENIELLKAIKHLLPHK